MPNVPHPPDDSGLVLVLHSSPRGAERERASPCRGRLRAGLRGAGEAGAGARCKLEVWGGRGRVGRGFWPDAWHGRAGALGRTLRTAPPRPIEMRRPAPRRRSPLVRTPHAPARVRDGLYRCTAGHLPPSEKLHKWFSSTIRRYFFAQNTLAKYLNLLFLLLDMPVSNE